MERSWMDERSPEDAPVEYSNEEASAWSSGYNAAIWAYQEEQNEQN